LLALPLEKISHGQGLDKESKLDMRIGAVKSRVKCGRRARSSGRHGFPTLLQSLQECDEAQRLAQDYDKAQGTRVVVAAQQQTSHDLTARLLTAFGPKRWH
jgi:hypothetical protein